MSTAIETQTNNLYYVKKYLKNLQKSLNFDSRKSIIIIIWYALRFSQLKVTTLQNNIRLNIPNIIYKYIKFGYLNKLVFTN